MCRVYTVYFHTLFSAESAPMSPPLYSENSCLLQFDPQIYQAGAHRCAHKLLSALSRSLNKDLLLTTDSDNHNLCLPGTLQSLLLKSKEISDSLEEVSKAYFARVNCSYVCVLCMRPLLDPDETRTAWYL